MTHSVLITGAAKRLGKAMALHLARQGWNIAAHYHTSSAEVHQLEREITALGRRCIPVHGCLTDEADCARIVHEACATLGPLRCLINNASTFLRDTVQAPSATAWEANLGVNLRAPLVLSHHFAAQAEGQGNTIINITDAMRGGSLSPAFLSYTLAKTALTELTTQLARALAPHIRVNAIAPGPTLQGEAEPDAMFARLRAARLTEAEPGEEELLHTLDFLLQCPAITGQQIYLGGGYHLGMAA